MSATEMVRTKSIHWGRAVGGALLAEAAQILASVLWVAIYSYAINPGHPTSVYDQHAQASGPWVSLIAGMPVFYFASRWIAGSLPTALALFGVVLVLDLALMLAINAQAVIALVWLIVLNFSTKLYACYLGGLHGARPSLEEAR